ncbi:hypothetical protein [uncultured Draconibacterium sp.]|uniref:hypothetical protein n=1 Tax=uncultured Draconibacterium sp. TaxID=1573823 RepID=UPI0029C76B59|nr:hypothetical protein [uncultured Draconibacterium sp.]
MKRLSFIAALFVIIAFNFGCHNGHTGENCIDNNPYFEPEPLPESGTLACSFYTNSKISIDEDTTQNLTVAYIQEGSNTVFRYYYNDHWEATGSVGEYDTLPPPPADAFETAVVFEVPSNKEEFLLSGNDLKRANAMYGNICNCSAYGYLPITSGCIKGIKINDSEWQIDINILAEKDDVVFSKMISDRFITP